MFCIFVFGGYGCIVLFFVFFFIVCGDEVIGVICNLEYIVDVEVMGVCVLVVDVEGFVVDELVEFICGYDVVVWLVGVGGGLLECIYVVDCDVV